MDSNDVSPESEYYLLYGDHLDGMQTTKSATVIWWRRARDYGQKQFINTS